MLHIGMSMLKNDDPYHFHNSWEIICNIEGEGYIQLDGGDVPFNDFTVMCVPPNVKHAKHSEVGFKDFWLLLLDFPLSDTDRVTLVSDDAERSIMTLMRILHYVQYSRSPNKSEVIASLADSIKQLIVSKIEKRITDQRVDRIICDIIDNFQNSDFSLEKCLAGHGYCSDHMRRLFREQTGKTPIEYLTYIRINNAKRLLRNKNISNNTITEISELSGYSDVSYFSSAFKKATGKSPTEYCTDLYE